jgi:SET domain-containing protein
LNALVPGAILPYGGAGAHDTIRLTPRCEMTDWIMLLVKTYLDKSPIHGIGVFAGEFIRKGTKIWRYVEGFDRAYSPRQYARLPKQAKDFLKSYGYRVDGEILLTGDYDRHINHSDTPNTYLHNGYTIARCNISRGMEITNDYREFDAEFCAAFLKNKKNNTQKKNKKK